MSLKNIKLKLKLSNELQSAEWSEGNRSFDGRNENANYIKVKFYYRLILCQKYNNTTIIVNVLMKQLNGLFKIEYNIKM